MLAGLSIKFLMPSILCCRTLVTCHTTFTRRLSGRNLKELPVLSFRTDNSERHFYLIRTAHDDSYQMDYLKFCIFEMDWSVLHSMVVRSYSPSWRLAFFRGDRLEWWNLPFHLFFITFRTHKLFLFILWKSHHKRKFMFTLLTEKFVYWHWLSPLPMI